jgi:hypothetical protein
MEQLHTVLLAAKVALFAFIITSPFYNVGQVFSFMNNIFAKIFLLGLIVAASFVDLQLAIVLAIAFFILMLNLNNEIIKPSALLRSPSASSVNLHESLLSTYPFDVQTLTPAFSADTITTPTPKTGLEPLPPLQNLAAIPQKKGADVEELSKELVMQNMYDFPPAECETPREATDAYMNQTIMTYYLDEKIKPYEEFITQLTNEELLQSVSNGAYLGSE